MSKFKVQLSKIGDIAARLLKFAEEETPQAGEYKLADGTIIKCEALEVGKAVTMVTAEGEVAAAEGNYTLEDGRTMVVGADGMIAEIIEKPAEDVQLSELTAEQVKELLAKFAEGVPAADQGSAIVTCLKALMEYNFGWKINEAARQAQEAAAIAAYQNILETKFQALLDAKDEKISAIEKANNLLIKQNKEMALAFKEMTDLVTVMGESTPAPISEQKSAPLEKDILGSFKK